MKTRLTSIDNLSIEDQLTFMAEGEDRRASYERSTELGRALVRDANGNRWALRNHPTKDMLIQVCRIGTRTWVDTRVDVLIFIPPTQVSEHRESCALDHERAAKAHRAAEAARDIKEAQ